jgi:diguanylate cyclase (GGDEF)-like protein
MTGLANRAAFEAEIRAALDSARQEQREHAVGHLDLDQFKLINDTCGHLAGDALLKQVADLLSRHVGEAGAVTRLGGDEFGLLLTDRDLLQARRVAENVCAAMRDFRFAWEGRVFKVEASIGLVPLDAESTPAALLAAADAACHIAKERGRGRVHIAHPRDRELAARHGQVQWVLQIQQALERDLFRLRYQRIVPLAGSGGVMAEILLSLDDAEGAPVTPDQFLPAAERFNMMPSIDRCVVRMVFERIRGGALLEGIHRLNINLSGQSLNDERFLDYVLQQLARTGVDPRRICFEITETAVIANMARAQRFIEALHAKGCAFALDDFGSGLSSFAYLRTLPVDYLKIDGLFVRHMSADAIDHSMVEAINQVGRVMGIRTIAESVEDEATLSALRSLGVDYAQGHAVHRPEWLE